MNIEEIRQSTDPVLFLRAMTTPGFLNENGMIGKTRERRKKSRVQLAWIGDRILFRVACPILPHTEHNFIVSAKHLYNVGEKLGIFSYLRCSKGEEKQYWTRCKQKNERKGYHPMPRLIAESIEALIAVIYLNHGYSKASEFIMDAVIRPYLSAVPS